MFGKNAKVFALIEKNLTNDNLKLIFEQIVARDIFNGLLNLLFNLAHKTNLVRTQTKMTFLCRVLKMTLTLMTKSRKNLLLGIINKK